MQKLAAHAIKLSRTIFASLPWGFRLAHLLTKLAASTHEVFGRFIYAEFLKAGVVGLPDVNGVPALSLRSEIQGPRAADKLPRGYGKDFGEKVWRTLLVKIHNPEIAEEAISRMIMKATEGSLQIREGTDIRSAEGLIIKSAINAALDAVKYERYRIGPSHPNPNENDDESEVDITDPRGFHELEHRVTHSDMAKILRELKQVNDRAPAWVEAQLEGLSNVEIAEEWGVSPAYVTKWTRTYTDRIQTVFNKYLRAVA